jgi:hypothetical protein
MSFIAKTLLISGGLFVAMIVLELVGIRVAAHRAAKHGEHKVRGNVVESGVFGLLGLMIAFSFYSSTGRFDQHRKLIIDEVNAASTAYFRIDLLPASAQPGLRASFRDYVQSRVDVYRADPEHWPKAAEASRLLRENIWSQAVVACRSECSAATMNLVFSSLNTMFDLATSQWLTGRLHPPTIVFVMLFGLALAGALLVGHDIVDFRPRSLLYLLTYPFALSFITWVILDLEFPRRGVIRIDDFDELFVTMHERMPS